MTLQNLVGISLDRIAPAKDTIRRLLDGAARHIADARVQAISAERASVARSRRSVCWRMSDCTRMAIAFRAGGVERSTLDTAIEISSNGASSVPSDQLATIVFKRFADMNRVERDQPTDVEHI